MRTTPVYGTATNWRLILGIDTLRLALISCARQHLGRAIAESGIRLMGITTYIMSDPRLNDQPVSPARFSGSCSAGFVSCRL